MQNEEQSSLTLLANAKSVPELQTIRSILLEEEWMRLTEVEQHTRELTALAEEIQDTIGLLKDAYQTIGQTQAAQKGNLQTQIQHLESQLSQQRNYFNQRLEKDFGVLLGRATVRHPQQVGTALSPVISEAIRQTIEREPELMVKALSPILFRMIQQAITDALRAFQERIDAQLRRASQPKEMWFSFWARLRGIEPSEVLMRDALPFSIEEVFLIQPGSGLLIGHWRSSEDESDDSELISGMLTAVRDFVRDSFSDSTVEEELSEVQYGSSRILIQDGKYAYLAVVIEGTQPQDFRLRTRQFIAELNQKHADKLREFQGSHETQALFKSELARLAYTVQPQ